MKEELQTSDFDYALPPELIAQHPAPRRDQSRLLVLQRPGGQIAHRRFPDLLEYLRPGDVMVFNNSKVIPARLRGVNAVTGGQFEILLVEENQVNDWWVMLRPGKRARRGTTIRLLRLDGEPSGLEATVQEVNAEGHRRARFSGTPEILGELDRLGEMPLPPYISREAPNVSEEDRERYQTVYAQAAGSVAAPTAGLHFTEELLGQMAANGVQICYVTLHVGLGTFAPVKAVKIADHSMHEERFEIPPETAGAVNQAREEGRRVIAVGTTTVRVLEAVGAENGGRLVPGGGRTRIFIYPPYQFKIIDALVTNFHLPSSTLLMMVSAFAAPGGLRGREMMLQTYDEAVRERYRFFSYGDAMVVL